ncbi:MAG: exopolysaccharide biosynthesis protein [Piscinibacter sp.]|uniref:exopolysaccharide biosynthesis protein n=1 Tax=Piscinibacter sp. TaxID=1903157 RepID=UPI003D12FF61
MTQPIPLDQLPLKLTLSDMLRELAGDERRERIAVADLLDALGDRALAALLFVFALPNVLPMPPGTSAILGAPMLFLAAQMAFNMKAWLPALIARRSMARSDFLTMVERVSPWLERAEKLMKPRLTPLAVGAMESVVGAVCLLMSLAVFLPIPLGNMLPALAICLLAMGILERDGLWVLAGLATAVAAGALVSGVMWAAVKATIYFVNQVLQ